MQFECIICYNQIMKSFNFAKDIKTIRQVFDYTQEDFANKIGIPRVSVARYEAGEVLPRKSALEKVFSFAFDNDFNINAAKAMLYEDNKKDNMLLFHGAKATIEGDIDHNHLNGFKDFGAGFYLSESYDSSASWVADRENGTCYCFYLPNDKDFKVLKFDVSREWMYAILYFRGAFNKFTPSKEVMDIIDKINNSDVIIAPIADNNMYDTLNSFSLNLITDEQCLHALSANNLGLQVVLKSKKACDSIHFIDRLYLCESEKKLFLKKKRELSLQSKSKVDLVISKYRRKGKYFDELFKKNG